jgi:hypothetical protein
MVAALVWYGMCELASAVYRQHLGDLPTFGYHAEFHEIYQKHTNPLNCRTSSSDITGYRADFHDGRRMEGARHGMCEITRHGMAGEKHGNGIGATWHV